MTESCGHARRLLWPESGPRSADEATLAARRHVEECSDCRAFFTEMEAMRRAVSEAVEIQGMPVAPREAVYARLAEARVARRRGWGTVALAAASMAAVTILAAALFRSGSPQSPMVSLMAAEHAKSLGGDRLTSTRPAEIEQWLAARVGFAVHVPQFRDARLRGARTCLTERGPGAVVEYDVGGRVLSYFIVPSPPDALLAGGFHHAAERGYRVVLWRDTGLVHGLVGDLSEEDLLRFARECKEQAMRLARGALGALTLS